MVQRYTPKIKIGTAKNIAKNLLSTQSGKKISETKFKQLLKQDKDLKKFVYSSKSSTLAKHQAKKFFNKVINSAKTSNNFKVSHLAKKMGIRISPKGEVSDIGLNKIYQKASTEELAAQQKPAGPSPEEQRREKRREEALKTFHKKERAEERQREKIQREEQTPDNEKNGNKMSSPLTRHGVSGSTAALTNQAATLDDQTTAGQKVTTATSQTSTIPLLILPLNNLSPNIEGFDWVTKKFSTLVLQTINSLKMFEVIPQKDINQVLRKLRWRKMPPLIDEETAETIVRETKVQLAVLGHVKKTGAVMEINIQLINTKTNQKILLANIKEETDDLFDLEKKISWQITNALQNQEDDKESQIPSPDEAKDLPI